MNPDFDSVVLEHAYDLPPALVFRAWIDPMIVGQWLGCADDRRWTVHTWDARAGGVLHVSLDFDDGRYDVRGEFLIVEPPHHLQYRWTREEIVDVTILAVGPGSHLRLEHRFPANAEARARFAAGWTHSLDQLEFACVAAR
jgi:uncharacterized protein YndB with AHSA1/START domain